MILRSVWAPLHVVSLTQGQLSHRPWIRCNPHPTPGRKSTAGRRPMPTNQNCSVCTGSGIGTGLHPKVGSVLIPQEACCARCPSDCAMSKKYRKGALASRRRNRKMQITPRSKGPFRAQASEKGGCSGAYPVPPQCSYEVKVHNVEQVRDKDLEQDVEQCSAAAPRPAAAITTARKQRRTPPVQGHHSVRRSTG